MDSAAPGATAPRIIGRYALYDAIAAGGMATVHLGRLVGAVGFTRPVAIKRLHAQFAKDPEFASMFIDEARLAARVRHPNVVPMLDVVAQDGEIFLVMEYVHGESFSYLLRAIRERGTRKTDSIAPRAGGARLPPFESVCCNIVAQALHGLHAAHEATGEGEKPLGIVHRDMSPQNVLVGTDGVARVLDFGVAKAVGQRHTTRQGQIKGKLRYVAPEQILGEDVTPRTDIWAASVMLWEALAGEALFSGDNDAALLHGVLEKKIPSPRATNPAVPEALADLVLAGLERDPAARLGSAREMAEQLEKIVGLVPAREVGAWVELAAKSRLDARAKHMADLETVAAAPTVVPVKASVAPAKPWMTRARIQAALAAGAALLVVVVVSVATRRPTPHDGADAAVSASGAPPTAEPINELTPPVDSAAPAPSEEPAPPPPEEQARPSRKVPPPRGSPRKPGGKSPSGYKVPLYGRD